MEKCESPDNSSGGGTILPLLQQFPDCESASKEDTCESMSADYDILEISFNYTDTCESMNADCGILETRFNYTDTCESTSADCGILETSFNYIDTHSSFKVKYSQSGNDEPSTDRSRSYQVRYNRESTTYDFSNIDYTRFSIILTCIYELNKLITLNCN
ncbi:hypothetical protein AVEN_100998-1 [Araneus ventricosus]|uniref:Uncharacterized protein n=1 Tax=Araneus ventricosus TaxID=182803 RepID=A0A4Y2P8D4_ARAVE|nr:hypothetical protein AVEN_100998-1 [Araneus ventricosus]